MNWKLFTRALPRYKITGMDMLDTKQKKAILSRSANSYCVHPEKRSFVISGAQRSGKRFLVFSMLYELFSRGFVNLREVVIIRESDLADIANAGFQKRELLAKIFNRRNKVFVIDGVGLPAKWGFGEQDSVSTRHEVWIELCDHVYRSIGTVIVITELEEQAFYTHIGQGASKRLKSISHGFYRLTNKPRKD